MMYLRECIFERYFTLEEAIGLLWENELPMPTEWIYANADISEFWTKLTLRYGITHDTYDAMFASTYVLELMNKYIFPTYYKDFVSVRLFENGKEANEYEPTLLEFKRFWSRFIEVMSGTYPRYSALIGYYVDQEGKLMDSLKSTSETLAKFNDTPQDGGDWDDDNHLSTITRGATTNYREDVSPIARLEEIRQNMVNLYEEWRNEFSSLFIYNDESEEDYYES